MLMLTSVHSRTNLMACLSHTRQPHGVKVVAVGAGLGYGATAGISWYADRVASMQDRFNMSDLPPAVKACGGTALVLVDSLSVLSCIVMHRKWTSFQAAGGKVASFTQWVKMGMPAKP